jgi:hypothetical protein
MTSRPRHEPVFLLAPARSYSTVCVGMLACHPAIYGFPELLLFTGESVGDLLAGRQPRPGENPAWLRARLSGLLRAVAEVHERQQSPQAIRRARGWLTERADWTPVRLMNHLLESVYPRIGLEKSPDTATLAGALEACLRAYPRARYLHLTRHPVTTQQSMQRHWAARGASKDELVLMAARGWHTGHRLILRALAGLPPDQWMRVRAEDLLTKPQVWLPQILGWLNLDCTGEIVARMQHPERWCFAGTGPAGGLYGGDPAFMRSPALRPVADPGPVRFAPASGLPESACGKMRALAGYLGY